jgi:hypothetical protein
METREFIQFCEAAEHGQERYVRYIGRQHEGSLHHGEVGKVLSCDGRRLEVETGNGLHNWPMEECEPVVGR